MTKYYRVGSWGTHNIIANVMLEFGVPQRTSKREKEKARKGRGHQVMMQH